MPIGLEVILGFDCVDNGFLITSNVTDGTFKSSTWSTGSQNDNAANIIVPTSGTYTVTFVDYCDRATTREITIPDLANAITITPDFSTACSNNLDRVTLTASANGEVNGYAWSTGDSIPNILVANPGTYSVTATDICDNEITQSITFTEEDLPIEAESVEIAQNNDGFCTTNMVTLSAIVTGEFTGIEWSTGETTNQISVPADGQSVTVTALDECGNKTATIESVTVDNATIRFPNIFFPGATGVDIIPENLEFGAYTDTLSADETYEAIQNYELHIFNRWGQEVFTSNDVLDRWNGRLDDGQSDNDFHLPDVYIWYALWEDSEGCTFEEKGNVTLFR